MGLPVSPIVRPAGLMLALILECNSAALRLQVENSLHIVGPLVNRGCYVEGIAQEVGRFTAYRQDGELYIVDRPWVMPPCQPSK